MEFYQENNNRAAPLLSRLEYFRNKIKGYKRMIFIEYEKNMIKLWWKPKYWG